MKSRKFILFISILCIHSLPSLAQIPSAVNAIPSGPSVSAPLTAVSTQQASVLNDAFTKAPAAKFYLPRSRFSGPFPDDGYPISKESFAFTSDEMRQLSDINIIKNALKREQRRLTKIFFQEHDFFRGYTPANLENLITEVSKKIDKSIDEAPDIFFLNGFTFDYFRSYLFRVSSSIYISKHIKFINPTGNPPAPVSTLSKYTPHEPFEVIAAVSLFFNIILAAAIFTKNS